MAITLKQHVTGTSTTATTVTASLVGVTAGSLLVAVVGTTGTATVTTCTVTDNVNAGNYTNDTTLLSSADGNYDKLTIQSKPNSGSGNITVTATYDVACSAALEVYELAGAATSSPLDVAGTLASGSNTTPSSSITTVNNNSCVVALCCSHAGALTAGTNFTLADDIANVIFVGNEYWLDSGTAGSKTAAYTLGASGAWNTVAAAYKLAVAGGTAVVGGGISGVIGS